MMIENLVIAVWAWVILGIVTNIFNFFTENIIKARNYRILENDIKNYKSKIDELNNEISKLNQIIDQKIEYPAIVIGPKTISYLDRKGYEQITMVNQSK